MSVTIVSDAFFPPALAHLRLKLTIIEGNLDIDAALLAPFVPLCVDSIDASPSSLERQDLGLMVEGSG